MEDGEQDKRVTLLPHILFASFPPLVCFVQNASRRILNCFSTFTKCFDYFYIIFMVLLYATHKSEIFIFLMKTHVSISVFLCIYAPFFRNRTNMFSLKDSHILRHKVI